MPRQLAIMTSRVIASACRADVATVDCVDPGMRRFWIKFQLPPEPPQPATGFRLDGDPWSWLRRGVGVTAADVDEALTIIHGELGRYGDIPKTAEIIYDVDVSTLDEHHILPNIGPVVWRGIWWPPGFTRWKSEPS